MIGSDSPIRTWMSQVFQRFNRRARVALVNVVNVVNVMRVVKVVADRVQETTSRECVAGMARWHRTFREDGGAFEASVSEHVRIANVP